MRFISLGMLSGVILFLASSSVARAACADDDNRNNPNNWCCYFNTSIPPSFEVGSHQQCISGGEQFYQPRFPGCTVVINSDGLKTQPWFDGRTSIYQNYYFIWQNCAFAGTVTFVTVNRVDCPSDKKWNATTQQCEGDYVIKLARADGSSKDSTILDEIEPGKTTTLVAKVYGKSNQLVPNVDVQLNLEAKKDSGGHHHPDDKVALRTGTLNGQQVLTGNTGPGGFTFQYQAPGVSGDIDIKATCTDNRICTPQGPKQAWVGVKGLTSLQDSSVYVLLPNRDTMHPDNHYMTFTASLKITALASLYHGVFPGDPLLHLNDASLVRGGLFDIDHNWSALPNGHQAHGRGEAIDVRANPDFKPTAISTSNFSKFQKLATVVGGVAAIHSPGLPNQHFHVSFK